MGTSVRPCCQVYAGMGPETVTQCFSAADDERNIGPLEAGAYSRPLFSST
jgi:hypothetical protein